MVSYGLWRFNMEVILKRQDIIDWLDNACNYDKSIIHDYLDEEFGESEECDCDSNEINSIDDIDDDWRTEIIDDFIDELKFIKTMKGEQAMYAYVDSLLGL